MTNVNAFIQGLAGIVLVGAVFLSLPAAAHTEPPPPPPVAPKLVGIDVKPLRWSWLHWWEANRSRYLVALNQTTADQELEGHSRKAMQKRAAEALRKALSDTAPGVRAESALALGRLRDAAALPDLTALLATEPSEEVRHRAILAIGLLESPEAEALLLKHTYLSDFLKVTGLLGFGWFEQPSPDLRRQLRTLLHDDPLTANAASESLRSIPDGLSVADKKSLLQSIENPWIAGRIIASLSEGGDEQTDALLVDIAKNGPMFQRISTWRFLENTYTVKRQHEGVIERGGDPGRYRRALNAWWATHDAFANLAPEPQRPEGMYGLPPALYLGEARGRDRLVNGLEQIYQARLRAAAVIVLGESEVRGAGAALRVALADDDEYSTVPRAYAAVALGQIGDLEALPSLIAVASGKRSSMRVAHDDPLRGFAALGLGLYARPIPAEQGEVDRPGHETAIETLVETMSDPKQNVEVRSACAVALGISARSSNLRPMIMVSRTLGPTDDSILLGHLLLARAMLGDRNVIAPAEALLSARPNRDETADLLGRRAAVLAMGQTGRDEAIPHLIEAWNEPFYVNREVIYALSLSGASGVAETLIKRLEESDNRFEREYMARSLGELLRGPQSRDLAERFLVAREFTMKDGLLEDARLLANRFLYEYLIPSFEEPWY